MTKPAKVIWMSAIIGAAAAVLAYCCTRQVCCRQAAGSDDLAWLRREFRLADAEMARVRELHKGYLPKCEEMCGRIAAKQSEVEKALAGGTNGIGLTEEKLVELGTLRAQCQAQMLMHFEEVSRAMTAEQGKRYLAEMQRLTLGFHQQFESSMGEAQRSGHAHGDH
jgi:hypothetical protein